MGDSSGLTDDEIYNPTNIPGENVWEPAPETIINLYERISKGEILELNWKHPGRITDEVATEEETTIDDVIPATPEVDQKIKDKVRLLSMFDEDDKTHASHTPTLNKTPKRAQTKQKASFDKIYSRVTGVGSPNQHQS